MSDTPSYLESNKPEAERCVEMAAAAWKAGDLAKAQRMLQKSLKLYPTTHAQRLIQQLAADVERSQAREQARNENARQAAHEQAQQRQREHQQQQQQQQRQAPQQPHQRPAAAAAAHSTPSKSASASAPATPGANYTVEQSESARVIISKRKNYYEIFSVQRTATETEIKSSYRKLALRFHPDKNKAPEAEEAFKVVNAAFQCLSDADKRAHYDAYGVEESGGGGRPQQYRQQYQREEDLSADEVFRMFFSGMGMDGGGGGGGPRRTYTYRRQAAPRHTQHEQHDGSPAAIFSQFAHFLPLLLLLLFGLLSAPGGDEQVFSLDKTGAFPVARVSTQARVPYFVGHQFAYRFQRDRRAMEHVEMQVEAQAFKLAEEQCNKQKRALAEEERRVKKEFRGKELAARLQAMQDRQLDACERLSAYKANMHGAKAG